MLVVFVLLDKFFRSLYVWVSGSKLASLIAPHFTNTCKVFTCIFKKCGLKYSICNWTPVCWIILDLLLDQRDRNIEPLKLFFCCSNIFAFTVL